MSVFLNFLTEPLTLKLTKSTPKSLTNSSKFNINEPIIGVGVGVAVGDMGVGVGDGVGVGVGVGNVETVRV
jgi:hypothetical protein